MVRFKNRYITIEIVSQAVPDHLPLPIQSTILQDTILNKINQLHGDYGAASVRTGFMAKYCNENTRVGIIRCRHGPHQLVICSIPFITKIGQLNATIRTRHIGATIKHSFVFIYKYHRKFLNTMWSKLKTDEERKALEVAIAKFTRSDISIYQDKML